MRKSTLSMLCVSALLFGCTATPNSTQVNTSDLDQHIEEENDLPLTEIIVAEESEELAPPEKVVLEKTVPEKSTARKPSLPLANKDGTLILGGKEWLYLPNINKTFPSEVKTELEVSMASAGELMPFERNGKKWVRFRIIHNNVRSEEFSLPILRWITVVKEDNKEVKRPVVMAWIQVGKLKERTEFLLVDKDEQAYPFTLGRSFYRDIATVDESRSYVQPKVTKK